MPRVNLWPAPLPQDNRHAPNRQLRPPRDQPAHRRHHRATPQSGRTRLACLTFPEVPNYRDSYLYLYPDGSMAACSDEGYPSIVDGYDLTILTAIFRVCAELPNPCPCRLVCCPDSHLRCRNCDATADLVLVGSLPLCLRHSRCRTCHQKWQLGFLDYVRRTAP